MIENFTNLLGCQAVWCRKYGWKHKELCTAETGFLLMALRLLLGLTAKDARRLGSRQSLRLLMQSGYFVRLHRP